MLTPEQEQQLLKQLTPPQKFYFRPRFSYIIIGKPGCGKSTLGEKLANYTRAKLINPFNVIDQVLKNNLHPQHEQVASTLQSGGIVTSDMIVDLMFQESLMDESDFKGVIIDGLPGSDNDMEFDLLLKTVQRQGHSCVLIQLNISDANLLKRRSSQWIDPSNNQCYSGQQVLYSRQRRAEGYIDGEEDTVATEEMYQLYGIKSQKEKTSEENEDEDEEKVIEPEKKPFTLRSQISWPILSEQVLGRLIKFDVHDPSTFLEQIEKYNSYTSKLDTFRSKHFNLLNVVDLDATLHPDMLFDQIKKIIMIRGFSLFNPVIFPRKLPCLEGGFKDAAEADVWKHYTSIGLVEGEPNRESSIFKNLCPVSFALTGNMVETDYTYATLYKCKIYFTASEIYQEMFITHPEKYLEVPLEIKRFKLVILGGPASGKTTQARVVSKKYNLKYISIDEILTAASFRRTWLDEHLKDLKYGKSIPIEVYMRIIKTEIENAEKNGYFGWVLDAFPSTTNQAKLLISQGITPTHVLALSTTANDDNVRSREQPIDLPIKMGDSPGKVNLPFFSSKYAAYKDEIVQISAVFEENGIHTISIDAEKAILPTLTSIVTNIDPFIPKAIPYTLEETVDPEWGPIKDFCPYSLIEKRQILKGNRNFAIKFKVFEISQKSGTSICSSDEARAAILAEPTRFLTAPIELPPRFIFIGTKGSGRKTFAKQLGDKWNIPNVDFKTLCTEYLEQNPEVEQDSTQPISVNNLTEIFNQLYVLEPYASKGFILYGFPTGKNDLDIILKNGCIPDAFVFFKCDATIAVRRIFPQELQKFEQQKEIRRQEIEKRKLLEPNQEPQEEKPEQTEQEFKDELIASIDRESSILSDYLTLIETIGKATIIEVSSAHCMRPTWDSLQKKLKPYLEDRKDLFSRAYPLTEKQAALYLEYGAKSYSNIGFNSTYIRKFCPVSLTESRNLSMNLYGTLPVAFGHEIFFLKDQNSLREFLNSPLRYSNHATPPPMIFPTLCIVGDAKAGKTSLAKSLALQFDSVYLTIPKILQAIIDGQEMTALSNDLIKVLEQGSSVPDEMTTEAVILITSRLTNSGKGWILDGFPYTLEQASLLEAKAFQPHCIIELNVDDNVTYSRAASDFKEQMRGQIPRMNHKEIVKERQSNHLKYISSIRQLFSEKFSNWTRLQGSQSKWALKTQTIEISDDALIRRQNYLDRKQKGQSAPIFGIGMNIEFMKKNLAISREYCPVSYEEDKIIMKASDTFRYAAEYKQEFYCMSNEVNLNKFLNNPEKYTKVKLPEHLPKQCTREQVKNMFPKQIELRGYCPVTFLKGQGKFESIIPGDPELVVEYKDKLYCFLDENSLNEFNRTPWKFVDLKLPAKLPPPVAPISVQNLPMSGYLEQTVARSLTTALTSLGRFKPKHPFKSLNRSASEYLGLYLKANNPKTKEWIKDTYQKRLDKYKANCELVAYLVKHVKDCSSEEIDQNLNSKMDEFLQFSTAANNK